MRDRIPSIRFSRQSPNIHINAAIWLVARGNKEGYPDPTAALAVGRVTKEEKKKKEAEKNVCISRKLKNGQKI